MNLGECIKSARKKAGYTQKVLAQKSGLAEITIRQYETNKREPRSEQIEKIASALGIEVNELYNSTTVGVIDNSVFQGTTEDFLLYKEVNSIIGLKNFLSFYGVEIDQHMNFIFEETGEKYNVRNIGILADIGAEQIKILIKKFAEYQIKSDDK